MLPNTQFNLSALSFKDYVSTFAREETEKPYTRFYSEAIRKHRQQLLMQM